MLQKMLEKDRKRSKRKTHIRKAISGTPERPRMTVTRSNRALYIQVIDDSKVFYDLKGPSRGPKPHSSKGHTLASASTLEDELKSIKPTVAGGAELGEIIGKRLLEKEIKSVVFDRNGYLYHGVVKAIADGVRKAGIQF